MINSELTWPGLPTLNAVLTNNSYFTSCISGFSPRGYTNNTSVTMRLTNTTRGEAYLYNSVCSIKVIVPSHLAFGMASNSSVTIIVISHITISMITPVPIAAITWSTQLHHSAVEKPNKHCYDHIMPKATISILKY